MVLPNLSQALYRQEQLTPMDELLERIDKHITEEQSEMVFKDIDSRRAKEASNQRGKKW